MARRRDEGGANRATELGADRDVLQVRVARREAPRGRDRLVEARVDAPRRRVDVPGQRVDVRPLELVELAELEDARSGSACCSASASRTSASVERPPLGVRLTTGSRSSSKRIFSSWSRDRKTKVAPRDPLALGLEVAKRLLDLRARASRARRRRRARRASPSSASTRASGISTSRIRRVEPLGREARLDARRSARASSASARREGRGVLDLELLEERLRTARLARAAPRSAASGHAELATRELLQRRWATRDREVSARRATSNAGPAKRRARAREDDRRLLDVVAHLA